MKASLLTSPSCENHRVSTVTSSLRAHAQDACGRRRPKSPGAERRLSPVCLQVLMALLGGGSLTAQAGDYFDPALLNLAGGQSVDLSQFERPGGRQKGLTASIFTPIMSSWARTR